MDILKDYKVTDHDSQITRFINKIDELSALDDEQLDKQYKKSTLYSLLNENNGKGLYDDMAQVLIAMGGIVKPIWDNNKKIINCRKAMKGKK